MTTSPVNNPKIVDTQGIDFADIAQLLGAKPGAILTFILKNKAILDFVINIFKHKANVPPVNPGGVTLPTTNEPQVPSVPEIPREPVSNRRIDGLETAWFYFSLRNEVISNEEKKNIVAGNQPINKGYRCHINSTPKDNRGQKMYHGDKDADRLLLQDPSKGQVEGNSRIEHHLFLDGEEYVTGDMDPTSSWGGQNVVFLTSEYDDAALTPVITVNRDLSVDEQHVFSYQAIYIAPDGRRISSNKLTDIKIHVWGD